MKLSHKNILYVVLGLVLLATSTQRGYASDFLDGNIHVGCGISAVTTNYSSAIDGVRDYMQAPGCLMRTGFDVRFNIKPKFGLGTGLEASINNSRFAMSIVSNNTASISSIYISNHFYDINIPIYLSWLIDIGTRMKWNIDVGSYFSYGITGNVKASGYTSGLNSLGQPVVTHASYSSPYFDNERAYINGVKRNDFGPRLATGLVYHNKYTFNIVLQYSIRNLAINQSSLNARYRNLSLMFQFGYNIF